MNPQPNNYSTSVSRPLNYFNDSVGASAEVASVGAVGAAGAGECTEKLALTSVLEQGRGSVATTTCVTTHEHKFLTRDQCLLRKTF